MTWCAKSLLWNCTWHHFQVLKPWSTVAKSVTKLKSPVNSIYRIPNFQANANNSSLHISVAWNVQIYYKWFREFFTWSDGKRRFMRPCWEANKFRNYPQNYGTVRFITVYTRAHHWSLSSATWIRFTPSHLKDQDPA